MNNATVIFKLIAVRMCGSVTSPILVYYSTMTAAVRARVPHVYQQPPEAAAFPSALCPRTGMFTRAQTRTLTVSSSSICTLNVCCWSVFRVIVSIVFERETPRKQPRKCPEWARVEMWLSYLRQGWAGVLVLREDAIYLLNRTRHVDVRWPQRAF